MKTLRVAFLSFLSALLLASSLPAAAQTVEGCSPTVMNAMKAKAEAKVAYDVAVTEQVVDKPDSVLATTCFNKAASNSAQKGGAIFSDEGAAAWSGPLATGLKNVVEPSLDVMYENFEGSAGIVLNPVTALPAVEYDGDPARAIGAAAGGTDCEGVKNLWEQIQSRGVAGGIPFVTQENLMNTGFGGGAGFGDDFESNWLASSSIFTNLDTSVGALGPTAVPAFSGNSSSCQVLQQAGVVSTCP
jgi:hypothetical protein